MCRNRHVRASSDPPPRGRAGERRTPESLPDQPAPAHRRRAAPRWRRCDGAPRTLAPNAARLRYDYEHGHRREHCAPARAGKRTRLYRAGGRRRRRARASRRRAEEALVIVMHASVGSGHRSAAYAVAQAFELMRDADGERTDGQPPIPDDLDIEVIDVLDYGRIVFDGNNAASLFTGATRPIYDLTWRFTLTGRLLCGGGSIWSHLMYSKFTDYVRDRQPRGHRVHAHHRRQRGRGGAHADGPALPHRVRSHRLRDRGPLAAQGRRSVLRRERVDGRDAAPAQGARGEHPHHRHPHARRFPPRLRPPLRARAVGAAPG